MRSSCLAILSGMMKKTLITAILGLLVWSAIPAGPARATSTIFIDDSRDGVQCPGARDLVDLSTLNPFPIANGQTLTLCSGEYTGTLFIEGGAQRHDHRQGRPGAGSAAHHPDQVA